MTRHRNILILAMLLLLPLAARGADVHARLSSSEAWVGVPLRLNVIIRGVSRHGTPTAPTIANADVSTVRKVQESSQTRIYNGRVTRSGSFLYTFDITPLQPGKYIVPPVKVSVDGRIVKTHPLRFTAAQSETGDLLDVHIVGSKREVYVGQSLPVTLQIYIKPYHDERYDITLSELTMWSLVDLESSRWGEFLEALQKMAQGRQRPKGQVVQRPDATGRETDYYRYDLKTTIYPDRPGKLKGQDISVLLRYPTSLRTTGSFVRRRAMDIGGVRPIAAIAKSSGITVLPLPAEGKPSDFRGAVGEYQIHTMTRATHAVVDEPVTMTIAVTGKGRLEDLSAPPLATLSDLTADFIVTDEPLAGIVMNDAKVFTTTVRPRRTDVTAIPAIPLSFFDPSTKKYVTVHSKPIPLRVQAAEKLDIRDIVSRRDTEDEEDSLLTARRAPQATSLHRRWTPKGIHLIAWLVLPPVLVLLWILTYWSSHRLRSRLTHRLRSARRAGRRRLRRAKTPADIRDALAEVVARFTGRAAQGLTDGDARQALHEAGIDSASTRAFSDVFQQTNAMRYAATSVEFAPLKTRARHALNELKPL